jgi:hypothetical protein
MNKTKIKAALIKYIVRFEGEARRAERADDWRSYKTLVGLVANLRDIEAGVNKGSVNESEAWEALDEVRGSFESMLDEAEYRA